jgi:hypothetical protein
MTWEIFIVGCLVLTISGIAVWAMRKTRSEFNSLNGTSNLDVDELAKKVAEANKVIFREVLEEFIEKFRASIPDIQLPIVPKRKPTDYVEPVAYIDIDESIIPIDIHVDVESVNVREAAVEEKVVDTDIDRAKSRLAGILNRKNEKET